MKMLKDLYKESKIAYHSGLGMYIFLAHRITGLALVFYLLMHIVVISSSLSGPAAFDALLKKLMSPFFLTLDLALLAAVLFHAFNGVRIILFDTGVGVRRQKAVFWIMMIPAAIIWLLTFYITIPHIVGK